MEELFSSSYFDMKKYYIFIRDLTTSIDKRIILPCDLSKELNPEREYIIVDHNLGIEVSEFESLELVNDFVKLIIDENISQQDISIYKNVYYDLKTFFEALRNGEKPTIINFTQNKKSWNSGCGGNFHSLSERGLLLFTLGYETLPFEYKEEYEEYIDWETVWNNAETNDDWKAISLNGVYYLVA